MKNITEDPTNSQLSYISSDAICSSFEGQTLLTVQVRYEIRFDSSFLNPSLKSD